MKDKMTEELKPSFEDAAAHPSVVYAEALMNGDESVTLISPSGERISYQIGQEYKYQF